MGFQQIFWDNDGVLVDTERYYLQASQEALASVGVLLSDEQFAKISLGEGRSVFELASSQGADSETINAIRLWRNQRYAQLLQGEMITVAGAKQVLEALFGKIAMAIVTSSQKYHFEIIHKRTGFLDFIDFCLTREDYIASKPSPEPYLLAQQRCGYKPEDILVIEDSPRGLAAAKSAGLSCWVIPANQTTAADFSSADKILRGIEEIPALIF